MGLAATACLPYDGVTYDVNGSRCKHSAAKDCTLDAVPTHVAACVVLVCLTPFRFGSSSPGTIANSVLNSSLQHSQKLAGDGAGRT